MSDYIPNPCTEMHINQMPEDCLRALFTQLPIETQFKAGDVCRLWRTVRDALFHTKKSLVVAIDNNANSALIIAGLNKQRTAFLVAMFPRLTELTIFISNRVLVGKSSQVAHLLDQYHNQLVTLKINSKGDLTVVTPSRCTAIDEFVGIINCMSRLKPLYAAINTMSKLKQLSLDFVNSSGALHLLPFDLPILRQLDKFALHGSIREGSTLLKQWTPHLEARSTPMEISFTGSLFYVSFNSITPKVGSMFTKFPKLGCNLLQFQHLSTCFTNLTQLLLSDYAASNLRYASDVPALMQALVNLKQLNTLFIEAQYVAPLNDQPGDDNHLPQLPTVKKWYLNLRDRGHSYSHTHLFPWTTNLGWLFPNLEDLSILLDFHRCNDCHFEDTAINFCLNDSVFSVNRHDQLKSSKDGPAKECLRHQLGLIKQQRCSKLNKARLSYAAIADSYDDNPASCALDDLVD